MLLVTAASLCLSVVFVLAISIHSLYSPEWSSQGNNDYFINSRGINFKLALAGCLSMTLSFICQWVLEVAHFFNTNDHTNTIQLTLNRISLRTQLIILITLIIPCVLLLVYPEHDMFWVLAHIQVHTLLQVGYDYVQQVCYQDDGGLDMLAFPVLLFGAGLLHYLSVMQEDEVHMAMITSTAALCGIDTLIISCLGRKLYNQLQVDMKESGSLIPEETQALRFVLVMAAWLVAYVASMLVIIGNYGVDFCLIHTIFVGILGFSLGMCHSVKSKQAAQLAEIALETKRIFVRHVSHEIRTPLNTTILGLRLLDEELRVETRDETLLHDLLTDINSSCIIAVDIFNDLLLYEKIEGGLVALETTELPVWDVVKEVLRVFRIQAKSSQIQLEYPDLCLNGYHVKMDKYKLSQVFRNLISNALKFTSPHGTVKVTAQVLRSNFNESVRRASKVRMRSYSIVESVFPTKELVRISVTDSGVGISKEDQKRLFREIVQFDAAKLQKGQGSGLGLWSNIKSSVRSHGSKTRKSLQAEVDAIKESEEEFDSPYKTPIKLVDYNSQTNSRESSGEKEISGDLSQENTPHSLFSKKNSVMSNASSPSPSKPAPRPTSNKEEPVVSFYDKRLLIVDDAPTNRKIVSRLLRDKIAHRDEAVNGAEAVTKCKESMEANSVYDVVILDYFMPEVDGPTAAKQMREMGFAGVIIGVTGNNYASDIEKFRSHGADHVLVKPLDADMFWKVISDHLSRTIPGPNQV